MRKMRKRRKRIIKRARKKRRKIKIDDTVIKVTKGKVEADITTDFPDATRSININGTANKFALYYKLTNDLKITYTHLGQEAAKNGGIAKCDRTGYIIFRTYDEAGNYIKTVAKKVTVRE